MRWERRSRSGDVIDARGGGMSPRGGLPGGRAGAGGAIGIVGLIVYLLISQLGGGGGGLGAFGVDSGFPTEAPAAADAQGIPAAQDPERDLRDFSAYVFSRAQDSWEEIFAGANRNYERAQLVLYRQGVSTGCGSASSAVGPFYCPADQRVYLDLSFFGDMERQLGAPGDFAWAYVIAHEIGHHVQNQLGTSREVRGLQSQNPERRQRAVGAPRAPGRLLLGCLGQDGLRRAATSSGATSARPWGPPRRWATTASRAGRAGA